MIRQRTPLPPQPGGGVTSTARAWSPAAITSRLFSATSPTTATNGAHVASLADDYANGATLTQATSAKQLIVNTAAPLDGHVAWTLSFAAATDMSIGTGGVTGSGDHSMTWIGAESASVGTGFVAAMRMGTAAAGSNLGTVGALGVWAGRAGNGSPSNNVNATSNPTVYTKVLRAGSVEMYVDGEMIAPPTADASYNNAAGFGIGGGFQGAINGSMYHATFTGAALSLGRNGDKYRHEQWIARTFPTLARNRIILAVGDSQTAGTAAGSPTTVGHSWISQIAALMSHTYDVFFDGTGTQWPSTAVGGYTTSQCLTNFADGASRRVTGLRPRNVIVIWAGTNNLFADTGAAGAWADIDTMIAAGLAAGADVYTVTPLRRTQALTPVTYPAQRTLLRAHIIANAAGATGVIDLDTDARFDDPDDATYFQTGATGVHLNVVGNAIVAQMIATAIGSA